MAHAHTRAALSERRTMTSVFLQLRLKFLFNVARALCLRPYLIHVENMEGYGMQMVSYKRQARARGWKV
jgi:hypothetical protein